ncbi:MAG: hypothetical protein JO122_16945 [Acetobacteraceae bacterium]|nr:hypothetical protein [Acetobacteraceae bacterium]
MQGLTTGAQQIATWSTGDILIYTGAIALVIAGFMFWSGRLAMGILAAVFCGLAFASGALGISRAVYGWFHSASLDQPANRAFSANDKALNVNGTVYYLPSGARIAA